MGPIRVVAGWPVSGVGDASYDGGEVSSRLGKVATAGGLLQRGGGLYGPILARLDPVGACVPMRGLYGPVGPGWTQLGLVCPVVAWG
jgi:hypothetical protein